MIFNSLQATLITAWKTEKQEGATGKWKFSSLIYMVEKCPLLAKGVKDSFLVKEQSHPIYNCNPIIWGWQPPHFPSILWEFEPSPFGATNWARLFYLINLLYLEKFCLNPKKHHHHQHHQIMGRLSLPMLFHCDRLGGSGKYKWRTLGRTPRVYTSSRVT